MSQFNTMCPPLAPISSDPAVQTHSQQIYQLWELFNQVVQTLNAQQKPPVPPKPQKEPTGATVLVRIVAPIDIGVYSINIVGTQINTAASGPLTSARFAGGSTPAEGWNISEADNVGWGTVGNPTLSPGELYLGRPVATRVVGVVKTQIIEIDPDSTATANAMLLVDNTVDQDSAIIVYPRNDIMAAVLPYLQYEKFQNGSALQWLGAKLGKYICGGSPNITFTGLATRIVFGSPDDYDMECNLLAGHVGWTLTQTDDRTILVSGVISGLININVYPCSEGNCEEITAVSGNTTDFSFHSNCNVDSVMWSGDQHGVYGTIWTLGAIWDNSGIGTGDGGHNDITQIYLQDSSNSAPSIDNKLQGILFFNDVTEIDCRHNRWNISASAKIALGDLTKVDLGTTTLFDPSIHTAMIAFNNNSGHWEQISYNEDVLVSNVRWDTTSGTLIQNKHTITGPFGVVNNGESTIEEAEDCP